MQTLLKIGNSYGIPVIEDAAEAIGSIYRGKRAGSMGTFGVFSFHGTKTVTTGEGGMFVTNDPDLYENVLTLSNHGRARDQSKQFWADEIGFKYKMSNIQAAIGCAQLERIEELIDGKKRIFEYYQSKLDSIPVTLNADQDEVQNGYWMPTIVLDESISFSRDRLLDAMKLNNIDARVFFWPLSMLPGFKSTSKTPVSYSIYSRAVNLPSYHDITDEELSFICNTIIGEFQ
jgi:perosamine synthetase